MAEDKSIFRVVKDKDNPYVILNKGFLENNNLSWKAKGILSYLLSRPDDWKVMISNLINQSTDQKKAVYSGISELIDFGYIERNAVRIKEGKRKGQIDYWEYKVYEKPLAQKGKEVDFTDIEPDSQKGEVGKGDEGKEEVAEVKVEEVDVEKEPLLSNDSLPIIESNFDDDDARTQDPLWEYMQESFSSESLTEEEKTEVLNDFSVAVKNQEKKGAPVYNPLALFDKCLDNYMMKKSSAYWKKMREQGAEIKEARKEKHQQYKNKFVNFQQRNTDFNAIADLIIKSQGM